MLRNIRFRPALTAAAVAATAVGAVVLSAEPAFAIGPATVTKSGTVLMLTASPGTQDTIRIQETPTTFSLRDLAGLRAGAGSGCTGTGTSTSDLVCSKTRVSRLVVSAGDFDDTIGIGAPAGSAVTFEEFGGAGTTASRSTPRTASNTAARATTCSPTPAASSPPPSTAAPAPTAAPAAPPATSSSAAPPDRPR